MSYRDLCGLLRDVRSANVLVVADDFTSQFGYLTESERNIGNQFYVPVDRIDKEDHLIPVCSDHSLLFANINFYHKKKTSVHLTTSFAFTALESD